MTPAAPLRPPSARASAQPAPPKSSQWLLFLLLALSAGTTTIAWMTWQDVAALKKSQPAARTPVGAGPTAPVPAAGTFTATDFGGGNNFGGGPGGPGGPGGGRQRGGLSVANLMQTLQLNLDEATTTQLQGLIDQRTALQQDARNQGYQADTSALDAQMAALLGMDPQQLQPLLGGRGGRRGGGGGPGGG